MSVLILAFFGGLLTILSPCILPVLPFVFARLGQPFRSSVLPMLMGMAVSFAAVGSLAAISGSWVVQANQTGRLLALVLLAVFGLALLFPALADRLSQPLVRLGNRLSLRADRARHSGHAVGGSLLLGIAIGLLWAPCAGPILGLILTGAAIGGASGHSVPLLLAYGLGAATSLALALGAGGRLSQGLKRSLGASATLRRGLGAVVLLGVTAIALGLDRSAVATAARSGASGLEETLVSKLHPTAAATPGVQSAAASASLKIASSNQTTPGSPLPLPVLGAMPPLPPGATWLNSSPLSREQLKGKVVLIDFWTYSCINCLRTLPHLSAWAEKYRNQGLVVIGVHSPEFAFERDLGNVREATRKLQVTYPVVLDNDLAIWKTFQNRYWPAHYFIDARGQIRHVQFGEGAYARSERVIQQLLKEAGQKGGATALVDPKASGSQAAAPSGPLPSPETYLGFERADRFASGALLPPAARNYDLPAELALNHWGLAGRWWVDSEKATSSSPGGRIAYRFRARDLHLVLGPGAGNRPVRFRVRIDGAPPGDSHGSDTDAMGNGVVQQHRLHQLVRLRTGSDRHHTFTIEFLDAGVQAYSFSFG